MRQLADNRTLVRATFRKARFDDDRLETISRLLSSASCRMRFAPPGRFSGRSHRESSSL